MTDIQPTYRFAMTGPYFVEIGQRPRISKAAAQFFLDWVYERARQIQLADPAEQRAALAAHRGAGLLAGDRRAGDGGLRR